jgi:uncharacterized delta-60 repeat protein
MNATKDLRGAKLSKKNQKGPSALRAAVEALEGRTLFSFGVGGTVVTPFSGSLNDGASAVLVQSDGKLMQVSDSSGAISLARYSSNGVLDPTFGSDGKVTSPIAGTLAGSPSAALQADDKVLVVTQLNDSLSGVSSAFLSRYTTTGQLDPTFGIGGTVPVLAGTNSSDHVAVLPSGEIVVAGGQYIEEYQTNGALDTTFGTNGRVTTTVGAVDGIALQGKDIILVGSTSVASKTNLVVARYSSAGVLDTTFGTAGLASTPAYDNGSPNSVAIAPNGSIFISGYVFVSSPKASYTTFVTHLTASGALDSAYGTGGTATLKGVSSGGIVVQPDGKAVLDVTTAFVAFTQVGAARFTTSGALDPSFGTGGLVTSTFTTADSVDEIALQPLSTGTDILIAGNGFNPAKGTDCLLARYTPAGVVDKSFGSDGFRTTNFIGPVGSGAASVVPDGHGGFLVGGSSASANGALAVADYLPDGQLNTKFGTDGTVQITFNSYIFNTFGGRISVEKNGKILIVGTSIQPGSTNYDFAIAQLLPDGALDPSFGVGGKVTTYSGALDTDMSSSGGFVIQPDGKILVAGYTEDYGVSPYVDKGVVVRYNTNGSLDTTFGTGGRETFNFDGVATSRITAIALEPNGEIMLGGYVSTPTNYQYYMFEKLHANGTPDTAFAPGGQIVTNFTAAFAFGGSAPLVLRPDGTMVVAGSNFDSVTSQSDITVAEFTAKGTPILSFGTAGQANIEFPGNPNADLVLGTIAVLTNGKVIVVGGYSVYDPITYQETAGDFAVSQLTSAGKLDTSFGTGGNVLTGFGADAASATAVLALSNGDLLVAGYSTDAAAQFTDLTLAEYDAAGKLV